MGTRGILATWWGKAGSPAPPWGRALASSPKTVSGLWGHWWGSTESNRSEFKCFYSSGASWSSRCLFSSDWMNVPWLCVRWISSYLFRAFIFLSSYLKKCLMSLGWAFWWRNERISAPPILLIGCISRNTPEDCWAQILFRKTEFDEPNPRWQGCTNRTQQRLYGLSLNQDPKIKGSVW